MNNNEKKVATVFDLAQMCKSLPCSECPLSFTHNVYRTDCSDFLLNHTEATNETILDWLKEKEEEKKNKVKTYADDFFEKFPNAAKENDGSPIICIKSIYPELADNLRCFPGNCQACWNTPYEKKD